MHPAALDDDVLLAACQIQRTRRSGPGGQHRNKVETAVVITHQPTGVSAEASERRSQAQNRKRAIQRLRVNLALAIRESLPAEVPSPRWISRASGNRIAVNQDHFEFPILLAEALDVLEAEDEDLGRTAERLRVTATQLVKLLRMESRAFEQVNRNRVSRGLRRLH